MVPSGGVNLESRMGGRGWRGVGWGGGSKLLFVIRNLEQTHSIAELKTSLCPDSKSLLKR